jgi:hypothetical protein
LIGTPLSVTFDEDFNNLSIGVGNDGNHIVLIVIDGPERQLLTCTQFCICSPGP